MSLIDSPMLRVLSGALDVGAFRQTLLSSNIANVDTPGYRTRDIDFRRTLASALEGGLNTGLGLGLGGARFPVAMAAHR